MPTRIDDPFFAHEPFGFGLDTFGAILEDASQLTFEALEASAGLLSLDAPRVAWRLAPWGLLLALLLAALIWDVRVRRHFDGRAEAVSHTDIAVSRWRIGVRRALLRSAGSLAVPALLWLLSYVPVQGLFQSAPWTQALSDVIGGFVVYRIAIAAAQEIFRGDFFPVPDATGTTLRRATVSSLRLVWAFGALTLFLRAIDYREDAWRLSDTLFRLSVTLLSFRLFRLKAALLSLLPTEGTSRYLQVRDAVSTGYPYILVYSTLLLSLWTAGFTRAASTVLWRSYLVLGLVLGAALLQRWFVTTLQQLDARETTLQAALLRQVDGFARALLWTALGSALAAALGLYTPILSLLDAAHVRVGETRITLLNVLRAALYMLLALTGSRLLRTVLDRTVYPSLGVELGAGYALSTVLNYVILALAFGVALITIGLDLSAMAVFAGALGVGIGFGLQDVARNLISGLILLFGQSVKKGDLITVNEKYTGYVEEVGARSVSVRTPDNYDLVIPSSELVSSTIVNWTSSDPWLRVHIPVGVSYKADVHLVRTALLAAAEACPLVDTSRPTLVWLVEFGDSSVDFELLVWTNGAQHTPAKLRGEMLFYVWDALKAHGIEIPFPQRDLHLRSIGGRTDLGDLLAPLAKEGPSVPPQPEEPELPTDPESTPPPENPTLPNG